MELSGAIKESIATVPQVPLEGSADMLCALHSPSMGMGEIRDSVRLIHRGYHGSETVPPSE